VVVISYLPLTERTSYTLAYMHPACAQGESEKSMIPGRTVPAVQIVPG
jgi:hypothetical protein